ncbi:sensor histidine kinase [Paenactinomyces guangxiensis]|uniref:histidine kinase n=1 Tax=Paenactinomyces guangxiensis TaxID=1490290 RepID=A0A7W1WQ56_9BACL|nr:HAMP domain-containing sensor histidine kinase [Paenactinomyces guangxiensis]MBA4493874.1 HAMP domain-containing histidine kinase [Paenactinomyces guangxiensis]MBH8591340.1 HAMP domain-containing histidine kinase [Paenactinomyces guangxiensis]
MFRKTLIRLTLQNSVVFLVAISLLGAWLYWFMEGQVFGEIDEMLLTRSKRAKAELMLDQDFSTPSVPYTAVILWDKNREIVHRLKGDPLFANVKLSYPEQIDGKIHSVQMDIPQFDDPLQFRFVAVSLPTVTGDSLVIQVIRFVGAEVAWLDNLRKNIIIGCCLAVGIAIAAGYWLARRALIPIQNSWQAQQQFVADASHELRTPLAVIRARAELLLRDPKQTIEEKISDISTIYRETRRLHKLVAHLLTLARSDSNQLELNIESFAFDSLVHEVAGHFKELAQIEQIYFQTEISPSLFIQGDRERLHQLLVILLDNAFKYTPSPGEVTLTCRKSGNHVLLEVKDTGVGIPEKDIPHIFDRFYRADPARKRTDGGTGLGLAIARWIVEKHGGKISVQSEPGKGTSFLVKL